MLRRTADVDTINQVAHTHNAVKLRYAGVLPETAREP